MMIGLHHQVHVNPYEYRTDVEMFLSRLCPRYCPSPSFKTTLAVGTSRLDALRIDRDFPDHRFPPNSPSRLVHQLPA